jgi:thioredoxin-related protein
VTKFRVLLVLLFALAALAPARSAEKLPPPIGPSEPAAIVEMGDDGLFHQPWFVQSFLDLKEDFDAAKAEGKRFAVIFEQRGCSYCQKMHKEVLAKRYINDYVRDNFAVVQLNMWGSREVTDFDGKTMPEKELAERWGVMFTPTVVFFKEDIEGQDAKWGQPLEVTRMSLGVGPGTFYDLFVWVRHKVYEQDRNFQRFHLNRFEERKAMEAAAGQ